MGDGLNIRSKRGFRWWWSRRSDGLTWGIALHLRPTPSRPLLSVSGIPGHWAVTLGRWTWARTKPPMTPMEAAKRGQPVRWK